jgi:hypothetical protein
MTARPRRDRGIAALLATIVAVALAGCKDASTATSPTTTTSPVTETFSGQIIAGGSAARSFTSASSGTVTLTLSQIGPPADLVVGFGIGIPQSNGSGCYLTQSVNTGASATPQLTVPVDAGVYCLRLYDLGTMKSPTSFTVTIVRP